MGEREPLVGGRNFGRQDPGNVTDMQSLTDRANHFNNEVAQLQRLADQVGTIKDSHNLRNQLSNKREECANLAKSTLTFMKKMKIERSEKVRYDRIMTQINDIFAKMQKISQESIQKERVTQLAPPPPQYQQSNNQYDNRGGFNPQPYREEEENRERERYEKTMQYQSYAVDKSILEERDAELKNLESELVGLNGMFVDIAQMIRDQGQDIQTIESNTSDASARIEEGVGQLQKASEYQKSSRNKLCCLALILVLVIGGVAGFVVLYFKVIKR